MFTFAKFCRLCLKNDCFLVNYAEFDMDQVSYYDKLKKIIPALVSECYKNFPPWICLVCQEELNQYYVFYEKCLSSHNLLKIYSKQLCSVSTIKIPKVSPSLQTENSISNTNLCPSSVTIKNEVVSPFPFDETESIKKEFNVFDEDTLVFYEHSTESNISIVKNEITITEPVEELNHERVSSFKGILRNLLHKNAENNLIDDSTLDDPNKKNEKSTQEEIQDAYVSVDRTTGLNLRIKRINPNSYNELSDGDSNDSGAVKDSDFEPDEDSDHSVSSFENIEEILLKNSTTNNLFDLTKTNHQNSVKNDFNINLASTETNIINHSIASIVNIQDILERDTTTIKSEDHDSKIISTSSQTNVPNQSITSIDNFQEILKHDSTLINNNNVTISTSSNSIPSNENFQNLIKQVPTIINNDVQISSSSQANISDSIPSNENVQNLKQTSTIINNHDVEISSSSQANISNNSIPPIKNFQEILNQGSMTDQNSLFQMNILNHSIFSTDQNHITGLNTTMNNQKSMDNVCNSIPTSSNTNVFSSFENVQTIPGENSTTNPVMDLRTILNNKMSVANFCALVPTSTQTNYTNLNNTSCGYGKQFQNNKIIDLTAPENSLNTFKVQESTSTSTTSAALNEDDIFFDDNTICKICNKKVKHLEDHMITHNTENYIQCLYCMNSYPKKNRLFHHLRTSHYCVEPVCKLCGEVFQNTTLLFIHMYAHYGIDVFNCPNCEQLFINTKALYRHLATIHGNSSLACFKCDKSFKTFDTLQNHIRQYHGSKEDSSCHICKRRFYSNAKLKYHLQMKHVKHICSICGKQYSTSQQLLYHHQAKHEDVLYKCNICSKELKSKDALYKHKQIHNENRKRFYCKTCEKVFDCKLMLVNHERVHTGDKPFTCNICGKGFSQKISVATHIRTHTGHKPFKCKECGKSYTQSYVYKMHMKKHHNKEENETKVS